MSILHFRSIERRRTKRVPMCINVLAYGEAAEEKFKFWTRTTNVSAHGGVMMLETMLEVGQVFHLVNEYNMRKARARVVTVQRERDGKVSAAFEFVEGGEKFWCMSVPAAGTRPLRRSASRPGTN